MFFKPEILTVVNQLPILISYVVFGYLFYRKLKANKEVEKTTYNQTGVSYNSILLYTIVILVSGLIFVVLIWFLQIKVIIIISTWLLWIILGIMMLLYSLRN